MAEKNLEAQLKELQAQLEAMQAQLAAAPAAPTPVRRIDPLMEEMVTLKLFRDNDKYKDPVYVGKFGKVWCIQRGVTVTVPRFVAEIVWQSEEQDMRTNDMLTDLEQQFVDASNNH